VKVENVHVRIGVHISENFFVSENRVLSSITHIYLELYRVGR